MDRLSRHEAANYVGFPAVTLDKLIQRGKMPPPGPDGLWDRGALDAAFFTLGDDERDLPWAYLNGVQGVYFAGFSDYVKIGVSRSLGPRLRDISHGLPEKLTLHAVIRGATIKDERALHRQFKECRLQWEWFRLSAELASYIEARKGS